MSSITRRGMLQSAGGVGLTAVAGLGSTGVLAGPAKARTVAPPVFTFASLPDFFNGDVADLSVLPNWDHGLNSINPSWVAAIDHCLGAVAAHQPDAVFHAGDMVEGRWNMDSDDRQLFGPVSQGRDRESLIQCMAAIRAAGSTYYPFSARLFADRGLRLFPTIGDHELLDDRPGPLNSRWSPSGFHKGEPDNRYYLVDHCKNVWASHFTQRGGRPRFRHRPVGSASEFTAYAVSFADAFTLITVDTFMRTRHGVRLGVFHAQLRWLRQEIARAKRRGHIVAVQGHIPIMSPTRWLASGRLRVPEGRASSFYQVLDREGVDLYLCGEVHDTTVLQHGRRAPVQISHGCIFRYGFNFLIGRLYPDQRLVVDLYEIPLLAASRDREIWSTALHKRQRTELNYGRPVHRGRLVQRHGEVVKRTQKLGRYQRDDDPYSLRGHMPTELY